MKRPQFTIRFIPVTLDPERTGSTPESNRIASLIARLASAALAAESDDDELLRNLREGGPVGL